MEFVPIIGSTNDRVRDLLRTPGGEGIAVVADEQSAGRGRRGRRWESPAGRNLTFSVGLRPALSAMDAWLVPAAAALAVRGAAGRDTNLAVKWPNDLVSPDGRKVAGILVETALAGETLIEAVIGIGINVNWRHAEMPTDIAERATSLAELAGADVPRVALLGRLLTCLDGELDPARLGDGTRQRYLVASSVIGRRVLIDVGERAVTGFARDIGVDGSLLVDTDHGRVAIGYGEVVRVGIVPSGVTSSAEQPPP